MNSCLYLYQIAQELENLEPSFWHDLVIALIPTIPSVIVSIALFRKNNKLQEQLRNANKQEAMKLEYLRFREQVGLTRWHIERVHSSLPYLVTSGEISSVKTRMQEQIDALMLSAERYSFISGNRAITAKTQEISLTVESLFPCIDDFMDSDEASSAQDHTRTAHDRQIVLEFDIKSKNSSRIFKLYSEISQIISKFEQYKASDEIKPQE